MFDIDRFVAGCREAVDAGGGPNSVRNLVEDAIADPAAMKAAIGERSSSTSLADAVLHQSDDLCVLAVSIPPGFVSAAHDHTIWATIGIYEGQEDNAFYEQGDGTLREKNARSIHAGETCVLGPDVIHAIANPLDVRMNGIHVYGGNLMSVPRSMWRPKTFEREAYDPARFFAWCAEVTAARKADAASA